MDNLHKDILILLRNHIVADVDVNNGVIQPLKSEYILSHQDVTNIQSGTSKEQKCEMLLDILPRYKFCYI